MAFDYGRLKEIAQLPNSAGQAVTNAASTTTYIRLIILYNSNTTPETVKLYTVPDNASAVGTAAAANQWYEKSLAPDETVYVELARPGIVLKDENDTLQWETTTASKVSGQIYGGTE